MMKLKLISLEMEQINIIAYNKLIKSYESSFVDFQLRTSLTVIIHGNFLRMYWKEYC